jgi:glucosyl-3-phosphoglycerate synthase
MVDRRGGPAQVRFEPHDAMGDDRSVVTTYGPGAFGLDRVLAAKQGRTVSVCIPARDEATTVGDVVHAVLRSHVATGGGSGLVDEVVVVDDGSADGTARAASVAGARVVASGSRRGKGGAMRAGIDRSEGDVLVFLDADVENTTGEFVTSLLGPLLVDGALLVKGFYERPLDGAPAGGGRVNELMARPLLEVLFPELSDVRQPLAGETATTRAVLDKLELSPGYGVEIGMLIDVAERFGVAAIAQVDLGLRVHRNRTLDELRPQAVEILRAALDRLGRGQPPGAAAPR